uniref:Putative ovule protein n=1 Tax=Solanum chacoense TaxID=4108 RepID=A0A0V0HR13_SOLCH
MQELFADCSSQSSNMALHSGAHYQSGPFKVTDQIAQLITSASQLGLDIHCSCSSRTLPPRDLYLSYRS